MEWIGFLNLFSLQINYNSYNKIMNQSQAYQKNYQQPPEFIKKLYHMIENHPSIISFSQDGAEVHVLDFSNFANLLLKYFRHQNWKSFIRQMNMYGFRKINRASKIYIFINPIFKAGNQNNFYKIQRKAHYKDEDDTENNLEDITKQFLTFQLSRVGVANTYQYHENHQLPISSNGTNNQLATRINQHDNNRRQSHTTNSVLSFFESVLEIKKKSEALFVQLKLNIEKLSKEKKNPEKKKACNSFKESILMMDQMGERLKQQMQIYSEFDIEQKNGTELQNSGGYQLDVKGQHNYLQQPIYHNISLQQNGSFSETSSVHPMIPEAHFPKKNDIRIISRQNSQNECKILLKMEIQKQQYKIASQNKADTKQQKKGLEERQQGSGRKQSEVKQNQIEKNSQNKLFRTQHSSFKNIGSSK